MRNRKIIIACCVFLILILCCIILFGCVATGIWTIDVAQKDIRDTERKSTLQDIELALDAYGGEMFDYPDESNPEQILISTDKIKIGDTEIKLDEHLKLGDKTNPNRTAYCYHRISNVDYLLGVKLENGDWFDLSNALEKECSDKYILKPSALTTTTSSKTEKETTMPDIDTTNWTKHSIKAVEDVLSNREFQFDFIAPPDATVTSGGGADGSSIKVMVYTPDMTIYYSLPPEAYEEALKDPIELFTHSQFGTVYRVEDKLSESDLCFYVNNIQKESSCQSLDGSIDPPCGALILKTDDIFFTATCDPETDQGQEICDNIIRSTIFTEI